MEKKDFGQSLKNGLLGAADSIKTAAQNVKVPDIKAQDIMVPDQVKDIFIKKEAAKPDEEEKKTAATEGEEETGLTAESGTELQKQESKPETKKELKQEEPAIRAITTENAIKIFYYLMAVDGEIFHSEEEKFDEIGSELDPEYNEHREKIVKDCKKQLDKVIDEGDYYDVVQDGVEEAILMPQRAGSFISPKLLVWDLLTIAYSDENYGEKERRLMKYIVRKFNIDSTIFLEMESSLRTLLDIERETNWIKTTDKPYLTIEAQVNELADRRNVIFESVKDLIML